MLRWPFFWNSPHPIARMLLPLSWLYGGIIIVRRWMYQHRWMKSYRAPVPVIVVGNITVGGAGKTPFVIWLVTTLRESGLRVVVVSRGYGGQAACDPIAVKADSDPRIVGDEAVLLAKRTGCPVYVGRDRGRVVQQALAEQDCDIVVADDGLQHYALERDIEIALIDGERRFGNPWLLPAGPLREPLARLNEVDFVVAKSEAAAEETLMLLMPSAIRRVGDPTEQTPWTQWRGLTVHAVAAIGNPTSFFSLLRGQGLTIIEHPFPDHYLFENKDLEFGDGLPVFMTEKDSVKCHHLVSTRNSWYVEVSAQIPQELSAAIRARIVTLDSHNPTLL